jgi:hypothetical protein
MSGTAVLPPPLEVPASAHPPTIPAAAPPMITCGLACPAAPAACASKIRIQATPYDG